METRRKARGAGTGGSGGHITPEIYLIPGGQTWYSDTQFFGKKYFVVFTGQLILSKSIKIVATSRQILRLKCTKFDFGRGFFFSAPDPLGELTALPQTPSWV